MVTLTPKKHLGLVFLIAVAVVANTYASSFNSGFMEDDFLLLKGSARNLKQLLNDCMSMNDVVFRPFLKGIFGIEYFFFGFNPDGFRWVNILLFSSACTGVYFFVLNAFNDRRLACLTALFYAIHPINQNMVLAFSSSYLSVQVLLTLASIYWGAVKPYSIKNVGLALVFFILALCCHETAMLIPFYILTYLLIVRREILRRAFLVGAVFVLLLAVYISFRLIATKVGGHLLDNAARLPVDFGAYAATFLRLVSWYLGNLLKPDGIVLIWSSKLIVKDLWIWALLGSGGILLSGYLFVRSQLSIIRVGLVWLLLGLLPALAACLHYSVSNLIIEPYWFAFASLGFMLVVAGVLVEISKRLNVFLAVLLAVWIGGAWIVAGYLYHQMWADDKVYGMYYLGHAGDYVPANTYMANIFLRHRDQVLAEEYIIKSHQDQLSTDWPRYYADRGFIDFQNKRLAGAKDNYLKAIALAPAYYPCYTYLGIIAFMEGDILKAEEYFLFAIKHDPSDMLSLMNMGAIYKKRGEFSKAIDMFEEVLRIDHYSEMAMVELLKMYIDKKDKPRIRELASKLLRISRNPVILRNVKLILSYP